MFYGAILLMAYFKYLGKIGAECYLKNQTVRFCQPNAYNDPFELLPEIRTIKEYAGDNVSISIEYSGGASEIQKYEIPIDQINNYKFYLNTNLIEQISLNIGTTCFSHTNSEIPLNLLMWAHYAESHQGMAIQLKKGCDLEKHLVEVAYRSERPIIDGDKLFETGHFPLRDLYVKSSHWQYEEEFRIARNLKTCNNMGNGIFVAEIHPSNLERVVLGVNCSEELKSLAIDFHNKFGTSVFFMRRCASGFGVEPYTVLGAQYNDALALYKKFTYESGKT